MKREIQVDCGIEEIESNMRLFMFGFIIILEFNIVSFLTHDILGRKVLFAIFSRCRGSCVEISAYQRPAFIVWGAFLWYI